MLSVTNCQFWFRFLANKWTQGKCFHKHKSLCKQGQKWGEGISTNPFNYKHDDEISSLALLVVGETWPCLTLCNPVWCSVLSSGSDLKWWKWRALCNQLNETPMCGPRLLSQSQLQYQADCKCNDEIRSHALTGSWIKLKSSSAHYCPL